MNLENYYVSGLPIDLGEKLGIIHQPTIKELFTKGVTNLDIVSPFIAIEKVYHNSSSNDSRFEYVKEFQKLSKISDLVKEKNEKQLDILTIYSKLIDSLKIIYKTEDIRWTELGKDSGILIKNDIDTYLVYEDNFDRLSDIVLEMFCIDKSTLLKEDTGFKKYKNKKLQDAWEKLQKYRALKEKKEELALADIINTVVHMNNTIEYDKVMNLTYYQLINSYKALMKKNGFDEFLLYKTSMKFEIKDDVKHWTTETRIKKSDYSSE